MIKKKIRCFKTFEKVNNVTYNYPIFNMVFDGWSFYSLLTCCNCGELFVIDKLNPKIANKKPKDIVNDKHCPTCNSKLCETIAQYPDVIKLPNGQFGNFQTGNYMPNDLQTSVYEFYELELE